jgi:hypothetical protein
MRRCTPTCRGPWRPTSSPSSGKAERRTGQNHINIFFFKYCVCTGRVHDPTSLFPPDLILYVNLVAKGAPKFFKTLAPRLTVLDIPYFADAYSRTVRPIDLHNF